MVPPKTLNNLRYGPQKIWTDKTKFLVLQWGLKSRISLMALFKAKIKDHKMKFWIRWGFLQNKFVKVVSCPKVLLTCHFSLNQTNSFYEKFLFSIFFGLYITTTFPCNLHKMIDLIDPRSHPQGVPQFQAQYIKLNTPCTIAILIIFIYMVANEIL